MAVGNVVSGILIATGTIQPAAGVEVLIIALGPTGANEKWEIFDGTDLALIMAASLAMATNLRLPITNSNYLSFTRSAGKSFYGGIQSK